MDRPAQQPERRFLVDHRTDRIRGPANLTVELDIRMELVESLNPDRGHLRHRIRADQRDRSRQLLTGVIIRQRRVQWRRRFSGRNWEKQCRHRAPATSVTVVRSFAWKLPSWVKNCCFRQAGTSGEKRRRRCKSPPDSGRKTSQAASRNSPQIRKPGCGYRTGGGVYGDSPIWGNSDFRWGTDASEQRAPGTGFTFPHGR